MAKADLAIAGRYAGLVKDTDLADAMMRRIKDGWDRTLDAVLRATGQARLLDRSPALDASIRV